MPIIVPSAVNFLWSSDAVDVGVAATSSRPFGKAEVEQLYSGCREHHVARLHVAMDHLLAVRMIERVGDFGAVAEHIGRRQRSAREPVIECLAFEILHHQIGAAFVIADVEQAADMRVAEGGNRAGFRFESRAAVGSLGAIGVQHLDGDQTIQACIAGLVDLAHPAGPNQRQDLVRAKPRTR